MSEIKVNNIQSLSGTNGPEISGTVEMNSTGAMSLPRGDTAYRGGRGRGVFYGGNTGSVSNVVDFITIATLGNALDFGDALDGDPLMVFLHQLVVYLEGQYMDLLELI